MNGDQPRQALQRASRVRRQRTALRRNVRAGRDEHSTRLAIADLLTDPPPALATLTAYELLRWSWRMYERSALELLDAVGASPFQTVGRLTERQRTELARMLTDEVT